MKCNPTTAGREPGSLREVVNAYIKTFRSPAAREMRFFAIQRKLENVIQKAALCELPSGKRHNHQRRIPSASLTEANRRLQRRSEALSACKSFAGLHALVQKEIDSIHMIGSLTVYDIAHRIGARVGVEPEEVYLHRGTAEGARALLSVGNRTKLLISDLPTPFHRLKPHEAEDCLCIYKREIKKIGKRGTSDCVENNGY